MRSVKITLGLGAAVCALAAMAVPAVAGEFKASRVNKTITEGSPSKTRGRAVGTQQFRFGPFEIECEKATAKGNVTSGSSTTFYTEVKYGECHTYLKAGREPVGPFPVRFAAPLDLEYHANGFAETGGESESEVKLLNPGSLTAKIGGTGCIVTWPAQTIPVKATKHPEEEFSSAVYSNEEVSTGGLKLRLFPSGFQKKLLIANEFKKIETAIEEGRCEEFEHPETKTGLYTGTLREEVVSGNLSFE